MSQKRTTRDVSPLGQDFDDLFATSLSLSDEPVAIKIKEMQSIERGNVILALCKSGLIYWDKATGTLGFCSTTVLSSDKYQNIMLEESTGYSPENPPNLSVYDDGDGSGLYLLIVHPDGIFFIWSLVTGKIIHKHAFWLDHTIKLETLSKKGATAYNPSLAIITNEWIIATCQSDKEKQTVVIVYPWKCAILGNGDHFGCHRLDMELKWCRVTLIKQMEYSPNIIYFGTPHGVFYMDVSLPMSYMCPIQSLLLTVELVKQWDIKSVDRKAIVSYGKMCEEYYSQTSEEKLQKKISAMHDPTNIITKYLLNRSHDYCKFTGNDVIDLVGTLDNICVFVTENRILISNAKTKKIIPLDLPRVLCAQILYNGMCVLIRDDLSVVSIDANTKSTEPDICAEYIKPDDTPDNNLKATSISSTAHLLISDTTTATVHAFGHSVFDITFEKLETDEKKDSMALGGE